MRAVVTAGGTSEPIDDVRVLTNRSTGRFGAAIANALVEAGLEVELIAGRALAERPEWVDARVRVTPFDRFTDLERALARAVQPPPDVVFMAAAVSDYSPARTEGKLSSDAETLTIVLRRNPKLLGRLRDQCGPATVLVGFKLLSGVTDDELAAVARRYLGRDRLDFVVANDQRRFSAQVHPIRIVAATGEVFDHDGSKEQVAAALVARVVPGRAARDPRTVRAAFGTALAPDDPLHRRISRCVPGLGASLWVEPASALPNAQSTSDDPAAIEAALAEAAADGRWRGGPFAVAVGERVLVGLDDPAGAAAAWEALSLTLSNADGARPVLAEGAVIGATGRATVGGVDGATLWIRPERRGEGLGDRWVAQAIDHDQPIVATDELAAWLGERGYRPAQREGKSVWFEPPGSRRGAPPPGGRPDRVAAASVCAVDPVGGRVLIGRRRVGPWDGHWAFPGGKVEPGETELAAALRELHEETGVVADAPPWRQRRVYVGDPSGERVFVLTCFVVPVLGAPAPTRTAELEAAWIPLDQARRLRPMAAGTRRILRDLALRPATW